MTLIFISHHRENEDVGFDDSPLTGTFSDWCAISMAFSLCESHAFARYMSEVNYEQGDEKNGNDFLNVSDGKQNDRVTPLSDEEVATLDEEADMMNTAL